MLIRGTYFAFIAILVLDLSSPIYADQNEFLWLEHIPIKSSKLQVLSDEPLKYAESSTYKRPIQLATEKKYYSSSYPLNKKKRPKGEKVIIINPRNHTWKAYSAAGKLLRSGTATAGNSYCRDTHRRCRTKVGVFRIQSLGSRSCKSKIYPLGRGGAPMPYCMFFNGNQGLHGSYEVVHGNISHGCVRVTVDSARWIRNNFATIGTKVIVKPY